MAPSDVKYCRIHGDIAANAGTSTEPSISTLTDHSFISPIPLASSQKQRAVTRCSWPGGPAENLQITCFRFLAVCAKVLKSAVAQQFRPSFNKVCELCNSFHAPFPPNGVYTTTTHSCEICRGRSLMRPRLHLLRHLCIIPLPPTQNLQPCRRMQQVCSLYLLLLGSPVLVYMCTVAYVFSL